MPVRWEQSWDEFFALYFRAVRSSVIAAFRRVGWHDVDETIVEDRVMEIFGEIYAGKLQHDPEKGQFRQLLQTVCKRRVVDFIRYHSRRPTTVSVDAGTTGESVKTGQLGVIPAQAIHRETEKREHRTALLAELVSALRGEVSPQVFSIFEEVKLHGASPDEVAEDLGVRRSVVDNSVYKAMKKLREIAAAPAWKEEF